MHFNKLKIVASAVAVAMIAGCTHYEGYSEKPLDGKEVFDDEIANVSVLNSAPVVTAETELDVDEEELERLLAAAPNSNGPTPIKVKFSAGRYTNAQGDFTFSKEFPELNGAIVKMEFEIPRHFAKKISFLPDARDAIWIDTYANTKGASPQKPYAIGQSEFFNFIVSQDGRKLTVFNNNQTSLSYVYALRFLDRKGNIYQFDPRVDNDGHGGSDVRIKKDIQLVGHDDRLDLPIYSWQYKNNDDARYVGVIAQDLLQKENLSDHVYLISGGEFRGFYGVDYDALGLRRITEAEWNEHGQNALSATTTE